MLAVPDYWLIDLDLTRLTAQLAFEALHATEYLSQPYKEAIQSLILLGNVLQNEMQPHAAWCLASTTMRLAQCLGVYNRPQASSSTAPPADQDAASLRYVFASGLVLF